LHGGAHNLGIDLERVLRVGCIRICVDNWHNGSPKNKFKPQIKANLLRTPRQKLDTKGLPQRTSNTHAIKMRQLIALVSPSGHKKTRLLAGFASG